MEEGWNQVPGRWTARLRHLRSKSWIETTTGGRSRSDPRLSRQAPWLRLRERALGRVDAGST